MDPTIHPGDGTTEELRRELARLRRERDDLPPSEEAIIEEIKRLLEDLRRRKEYLRIHDADPDKDEEVARLTVEIEKARARERDAAARTRAEWRDITRARIRSSRNIAKLELWLAERGGSILPDCPVSLVFDGSKLVASDGSSWAGVSGLRQWIARLSKLGAALGLAGLGLWLLLSLIDEGHVVPDDPELRAALDFGGAVVGLVAWASLGTAILLGHGALRGAARGS